MSIRTLYRNRMIVVAVLAVAAVAIGLAGLSDPIYFMPAAMMAVSAGIGFHLARSSYRFDLGLSGPPEWKQLVGEAREWAEKGDAEPAPAEASTDPSNPT